MNPDALSVFSTHIKYTSSKNFNSETGNHTAPPVLVNAIFPKSHTQVWEQRIIKHMAAIKCSMYNLRERF